jgi:CLIP-associating protein 1/2
LEYPPRKDRAIPDVRIILHHPVYPGSWDTSEISDSAGSLEILEKSLKGALTDPNPSVRETARGAFWAIEGVWHDRATMILESLDLTARKQLEKTCPNPEAIASLPLTTPTTPSVKKSSVAIAIAASHAKAKAIATVPPTLRHQATSSSHATRTTSPPVRRAVSPISPTTKTSNGRSSPSPTSRSSLSPHSSLSPLTPPRPRILSGAMSTLFRQLMRTHDIAFTFFY